MPSIDTSAFVMKSGDTMSGHLSLPTSPAAANAVRKDYVDAYAAPLDALAYSGMQINGSMEVNQKGVPATVTNSYCCDGWKLHFVGIPGSQAVHDTLVPMPGIAGSIYVGGVKSSLAAGDRLCFAQRIEGYRTARLGWGTANAQPITISFWSQHTLTGVYSIAIRNSVTNRSYVTTYTQNASSALEYKTVTMPGDTTGTWLTTNGVGIDLTFALAAGTTYTAPTANTWQDGNYVAAPGQVNGAASGTYVILSGVTVLPGIDTPTAAQSPLIMRPYDQELANVSAVF